MLNVECITFIRNKGGFGEGQGILFLLGCSCRCQLSTAAAVGAVWSWAGLLSTQRQQVPPAQLHSAKARSYKQSVPSARCQENIQAC